MIKKQILKTSALVLLFLASFSTCLAASTIEQFTPESESLQFGTTRQYTLQDKPLNDSLIIRLPDTRKAQQYSIKILESIITEDGTLTATNGADPKNLNSLLPEIVKFEKSNFSLQPGEAEIVNFSLQPTENLTPGSYYGSIVLESSPLTGNGNGPGGLSFKPRTIFNIIIEVPGESITSYDLSALKITHQGALTQFKQNIKNSGSTLLQLQGSISITDRDRPNQEAKIIPIAPVTLPPQNEYTLTQSHEAHPLFERSTANYQLQISEFSPSSVNFEILQEINESTSLFFINPLLIAIPLIILAFILIFFWLKWSLHKMKIMKSEGYIVKKTDDLEKIAKKYGCDWRKIAHLNRLKAPFRLEPGTTLFIPTNPSKQSRKS